MTVKRSSPSARIVDLDHRHRDVVTGVGRDSAYPQRPLLRVYRLGFCPGFPIWVYRYECQGLEV